MLNMAEIGPGAKAKPEKQTVVFNDIDIQEMKVNAKSGIVNIDDDERLQDLDSLKEIKNVVGGE